MKREKKENNKREYRKLILPRSQWPSFATAPDIPRLFPAGQIALTLTFWRLLPQVEVKM
jgi:hypothetical protein